MAFRDSMHNDDVIETPLRRTARAIAWGVAARRRPIRDGLSLVGIGLLALLVLAAPGTDSHAYWVFSSSAPYRQAIASIGDHDAFLYAPPAALFFLAFHALPWQAFRIFWLGVEFGALALVARSWTFALVAIYPIALELSAGNIDLVLAAVLALGFRYPALWSIALLTKVTPGVGLLWFAVRREWRSLATALTATAVLALLSFVVVPHWWPDWVRVLISNATTTPPASAPHFPVPLAVRLPVAALVVVWGARTDRLWTVPVAAMLALPALWIAGLSVLAGCLPLLRAPRSTSQAGAPAATPAA